MGKHVAVAVFTSDSGRRGFFSDAFPPELFDVAFHPLDDALFEALVRADGRGSDVAVVDAGSAAGSINAVEDAMCRFMTSPVRGPGNLRIIFLAPPDIPPTDPIFVRLIRSGIYDLIIPSVPRHDPSALLASLAVHPNRFRDVANLNWAVVHTRYDPGSAPAPKGTPPSADQLRTLSARPRGRMRIGVAGAMPRCGTTTAALAIANSLMLAGNTVAVLMANHQDFSAIKSLYRSRVGEDGAIRIGQGSDGRGIDIWEGRRLADYNQLTQYVVMDYGDIDLRDLSGVKVAPEDTAFFEDMIERRSEWTQADSQVLVSTAGATDLAFLHDLLMSQHARDLGRWSLFLNLASDRIAAMVQSGIQPAAARFATFRMGAIPDPLASRSIPGFVSDWFTHTTMGDVLVSQYDGGGGLS